MPRKSPVAILAPLAEPTLGVFRGRDAVAEGVTRKQLGSLVDRGVVERVRADTYRITAVPRSWRQELHAALLWGGDEAAASGRSAAQVYGLEGVHAAVPEIALPDGVARRCTGVVVHHAPRAALMVRRVDGIRVTGVEYTLLRLARDLDPEAFEIACEDARRRRLTSVPAMRAYLDRFGRPGRAGVAALRALLRELDPAHPARSTLEVKTRRLLVAGGLDHFVRELPLEWNGRTYRYDFAFEKERTILETNGRRWHDDPADYEHDHDKWSVPGRYGYRLVLATWDKVTRRPSELLQELAVTMTASLNPGGCSG